MSVHRLTIQYAAPADPAAFDERYEHEHVPLVRAVPGLARFTLSRPRALGPATGSGTDGAPYLVAELWFADAEAMKAAMKSPEMAEAAAHAEGFATPMTRFSSEVVEA
ncbi:EthD family reductase [Nocardioides sp. CER19]|uniref:EthD family reductase n=1 Tax=Nocardioides sp. CER19 TaxID=3038538 RepID=UPI0024487FDA|nr:EthD family reductase [Nocardioides sp. CER19]MDH2412525.1 EthD family reductase [Nocardioides sp. CER19]